MRVFKYGIPIFILLITLYFQGCVSVNIRPKSGEKSKVARFQNPPAPFQAVEALHVDKSWRDQTTGATVSYISDCGNPTDPSLENIFKGITSEIHDVKIQSEDSLVYNSRAALHSIVSGTVDGVETKVEFLIFKKHECTYILTYAALPDSFMHYQNVFKSFTEGFEVP